MRFFFFFSPSSLMVDDGFSWMLTDRSNMCSPLISLCVSMSIYIICIILFINTLSLSPKIKKQRHASMSRDSFSLNIPDETLVKVYPLLMVYSNPKIQKTSLALPSGTAFIQCLTTHDYVKIDGQN